MDPYQKTRDDRGIFGRIGAFVPGFRGYLKAKDRRNADKTLREHIADRIANARSDLNEYMQECAEDGLLSLLPKLERLERNFDKIERRIRHGEYGNPGFFGIGISDEDLQGLYQFDLNLVEGAKELQELVTKMRDTGADADFDLLPEVREAVRKIDRYWDTRMDHVDGLV